MMRGGVGRSGLGLPAKRQSVSGFAIAGQEVFFVPGSYDWVVPQGVFDISVVCVGGGGAGDDGNAGDGGGGGGSGGALAYVNKLQVTPGDICNLVVGAGGTNGNGKNVRAQSGSSTTFTYDTFVMTANGGQGGAPYPTSPASTGGTFSFLNIPASVLSSGGGFGGNGGVGYDGGGGGGGAGGYTGAGGPGSNSQIANITTTGVAFGSGGGGGAASPAGLSSSSGGSGGAGQNNVTGGGGGGAALFSVDTLTTNGAAGNGLTSAGSKGGNGGFPGGGGGGSWDNGTGVASAGGNGAIRIIWGGDRIFPFNAVDV